MLGIFWVYLEYIWATVGAYLGYIQREGDPERINRNSLGVMVGPGPLGDAIVLLFPRRPLPSSSGGIG